MNYSLSLEDQKNAKKEVENFLTVKVIVKETYGTVRYYPANSTGKTFAKLAGTTTLTEFALNQIKALGFQIIVAPWTGERL